MRAGKSRSLQKSNLLRHLHFFISLYKNEKENSCHTQKRVNQCSVTDTRRQMGPMYKKISTYLHMYTQDYAQKITQYVTYVQRPHKDSTTRSIPTRYTSTEDRTGKRLFWEDEMDLRQPGEQHDRHVHQNQSAHTQSLAWCQSSAMNILLKVQDFVWFFLRKMLKI